MTSEKALLVVMATLALGNLLKFKPSYCYALKGSVDKIQIMDTRRMTWKIVVKQHN